MLKRSYRLAPAFLLRIAGAPLEILETLRTPAALIAARRLVAAREILSSAKSEVAKAFDSQRNRMPSKLLRSWRRAIHSGVFTDDIEIRSETIEKYLSSAKGAALAEASLKNLLARSLADARLSLFSIASKYLPSHLVFAGSGVRERVVNQLSSPVSVVSRNKQDRADERHLMLYLQRIAAKNDSLSEFGPGSWGRVDFKVESLEFDPQPGIARREVFLERWVAQGAAAAINADPETRSEISPRPNPDGRIEAEQFVFTDSGQRYSLEPETANLLRSIDGKHPAFSLGVEFEKLQALLEKKIIRWELEVPALEAHAFDQLIKDISGWRDNAVRARWLAELQPIAILAEKFAQTREVSARLALVEDASARMKTLGTHKTENRFLYSASNPIGEECDRQTNFVINESLINEVVVDAEPWIDLWRDNYAFVASRVAAGLRRILEQAPLENGALPLSAFVQRCADAQLPLEAAGMVALAHLAFQEVRTAFAERLQNRVHLREVELTAEDCHFVRRNFSYPRFDECTYPSADLQLAAASVEAVKRREYQWVLAELHPPIALLHHGFYWSCPDKEGLNAAIESTLFGKPYLYYSYFAADFTATTAVRLDAMPKSTKFVAPQRSIGPWQTFHPAETEVFVDSDGDVGVRVRATHQYLGSFARGWVIPLGFHPFYFSLGTHSPRLRCGDVVVQRESWTVTLEELGPGNFTGISSDLVVAVEKLRAARDLPRHIFIRPTERALRRAGVEGRDKDTKPVYIDFESYLFLEIFHRWLTKAGEIEITEMLPRPDQLLWHEADGHRTFELRTQIIPR